MLLFYAQMSTFVQELCDELFTSVHFLILSRCLAVSGSLEHTHASARALSSSLSLSLSPSLSLASNLAFCELVMLYQLRVRHAVRLHS